MNNSFLKNYGFLASATAIFFVLLLIIFREFVFDPSQLMLNSDQLNSIGTKVLRANSLVVTEWDDSRLGGVPTIDALSGDSYHPLTLLYFMMDIARSVGFKFILTIWVAFVSAMLLGRSLTGSNWWGALLGFLYALSPQYFTYVYGGHDGKMMVFAIAPLALLAVRRIIHEGSFKYFIVFVLSLVWMILGAHLQLTYLFLWGAGFYALFEMFTLEAPWAIRFKRLGLAAGALTLGLMISSFQIIAPYIYTTGQSVRGSDEKTTLGHSASWSLHQEELASMILPGFIGIDVYEQENSPQGTELKGSSMINIPIADYQKAQLSGSPFYWGHNSFKLNHDSSGVFLTFLAFLCFFVPGKRRWATFWFLGATVALSYAMGAHSPLFQIWYNIIPGMKSFRAPSMSMFWMPLVMVMMAIPVLKSLKEKDNRKHLVGGLFLFALLAILTLIARFHWELFLGPVGFMVTIAYALLFLAVLNVQDQGESLSVTSVMNAFKRKLKGSSRVEQICLIAPFLLVGIFLLSGQALVSNPDTAAYFKPLNIAVMNFAQDKVLPGFIMVMAIIAVAWIIFGWEASLLKKACLLALIGGIELYFIDGVFVQNTPKASYVQPGNPVIRAIHSNHPDPLHAPRVLSLSKSQALSGNSFPLYNMRNADGFHDNELASYRAFRGGQNDANYLNGIPVNEIGALFDDQQWNNAVANKLAAVAPAILYHNARVMRADEIRSALEDPAFSIKKEVLLEQALPSLSDVPQVTIDTIYEVSLLWKPTQTFRVETSAPALLVIAGNYNPYWKVSVNGQQKPVIKAFGMLRAVEIPAGKSEVVFDQYGTPFLDLMNIGEVIFETRQGTTILPNAGAIGDAKLYGNYAVMNDSEAIAALQKGYDYKKSIILSEKPLIEKQNGVPQGSVTLTASPKMDTQIYTVESDRPGFMLATGNYHPYWKATVNGTPTKVYKAFGTLRAIEIPQGKSEVVLKYRSDAFHNSLKLGAFGVVLLLLIGGFNVWHQKKKAKKKIISEKTSSFSK